MKKKIFFQVFLISSILGSAPFLLRGENVKQWEVFELKMTAREHYTNPYLDGLPDDRTSLVKVKFTGIDGDANNMEYTISGFWDGGQTWLARFAPPASGKWSYESFSTDDGLNGVRGTITAVNYNESEKIKNPTRRGHVRVCRTGHRPGRYFEYSDGTPFLWIGDTWWLWPKRGTYFSSFQKLVDDRVKKGFTVGQLFCPGNSGRQSSMLDQTYNILDVNHMQRIDSMVVYANTKGLTMWIHAWWSRKDIDKTIGSVKMRRWWRYLIHRLGSYNVIWTLAGEYNMYNYGGFDLQFWKDLGKMIKSEDPYNRIVSAHPTPPAWGGGADAPQWSTGEVLHQEHWLDYNQSQVGHGKWRNEMIPSVVISDYARKPAKPVVVTEPWYEFILGDPGAEEIRFGAWSALLSGAAGHSYAGGHAWKAHVPEAPYHEDSWPMDLSFETNTLDYPGAMGMSYMAKFMNRINWWEFEPHPELMKEYAEGYCFAVPGRELVAYLRWGGSVRIDLSIFSSSDRCEYIWYDPKTGTDNHPGNVNGGGDVTFRAPDDEDWVLHIVKK